MNTDHLKKFSDIESFQSMMSEYPISMISDVLTDCGLAPTERGLGDINELSLLEKMTSGTESIPEDLKCLRDEQVFPVLSGSDEFLTSPWPPMGGENCPEEVVLEVEVISTLEEDREERTITNLDGSEVQKYFEECCSDSNGEFSDYGSESGTENMDPNQTGTLDLSKKDPQPQNAVVNLTRAHIPAHLTNTVFDMNQVGLIGFSNNSYLHYSGGTATSLDVTGTNGVEQNGLLDLSKTGQYYSSQRVKLEPNLGIDPSIQYKPEVELQYKTQMDYNHNEAVPPAVPKNNTKFETVVYDTDCIAYKPETAMELDDSYDAEPRVKVEQNYSSQCQNIPLTVTSPDDDNDSGTESISSKDSEKSSCNNKSDRKRPGRKKGQVSKVYHLWEFIRDVLADPRYCPSVIKWENEEEGIFRVVQSETAASLWGARKNNRTKMTYEKMSRSIRYSRKEGYFADIPKDKGYPKKLCFKFGKKAHGWSSKVKK